MDSPFVQMAVGCKRKQAPPASYGISESGRLHRKRRSKDSRANPAGFASETVRDNFTSGIPARVPSRRAGRARLNAADSKSAIPLRVSGVRIPRSPPYFLQRHRSRFKTYSHARSTSSTASHDQLALSGAFRPVKRADYFARFKRWKWKLTPAESLRSP